MTALLETEGRALRVHDRTEIRVEEHPSRHLLVFDGDCGFCRQWVRRWGRITGDRVEYRPYQEDATRFPEIGPDRFKAKVWLIEPDGRATGGAHAVLRLYALVGEKRGLLWLYKNFLIFAATAEAAYRLVARHREAADRVTRLLWGKIDQRPRYARMRAIFLRGLGVVYLAAFGSLAVQLDGLIGSRGILPAREFLDEFGPVLGPDRFWKVPTLLWLGASDGALHFLGWGGIAASAALIVGILPAACLAYLWAAYLSLTVVGSPFFSYQWDILLLESGLLGFLFSPWVFWLGEARGEPSRLVVWLIRWLVFRLMFLSGLVKLASGDPTWRAWEAMKYHYETQPLPTWTSWYAHQLPAWFHKASVGFMFWAELIAPILIFGPRRLRLVGFWSMVLLQVGIMATGNYGFFNLLTIVLCLSLIEDRDWGRRDVIPVDSRHRPWWRRVPLVLAAAVIVPVTAMEAIDASRVTVIFPEALETLRRWVSPLRSMNSYGLFAVMTTERPEITVEGSDDGTTWTPYAFRWKPGDVDRAPRFCIPHLPRLDWQMWFAALSGDCRRERWFLAFERRLFEGSPDVLALLASDPFPDAPPRYLRARLDLARFTGRGSSAWWRREPAGLFCPPIPADVFAKP